MVYREAAGAAGLPDSYTSHDLRHHYASVLLDAGESVHAVAERIGDTPQMVLSVYGHLMPNREDTTRKAVDAAWKAAGKAPGKRETGTL
jgi:integrase